MTSASMRSRSPTIQHLPLHGSAIVDEGVAASVNTRGLTLDALPDMVQRCVHRRTKPTPRCDPRLEEYAATYRSGRLMG
jgi:hypothetical protein